MEEFVKKQRLRPVTVGAQRFDEFGQPQVQAVEVRGTARGGLDMHVVAGSAADVAHIALVTVLVENRHRARRVRENRTANHL